MERLRAMVERSLKAENGSDLDYEGKDNYSEDENDNDDNDENDLDKPRYDDDVVISDCEEESNECDDPMEFETESDGLVPMQVDDSFDCDDAVMWDCDGTNDSNDPMDSEILPNNVRVTTQQVPENGKTSQVGGNQPRVITGSLPPLPPTPTPTSAPTPATPTPKTSFSPPPSMSSSQSIAVLNAKAESDFDLRQKSVKLEMDRLRAVIERSLKSENGSDTEDEDKNESAENGDDDDAFSDVDLDEAVDEDVVISDCEGSDEEDE